MRKGEQTRAAILEAALDLASRDGLEGLTIGLLAERMLNWLAYTAYRVVMKALTVGGYD